MTNTTTKIDGVTLKKEIFGNVKTDNQSKPIYAFTWTNQHSVTVQVITYGATITQVKLPDKNGQIADVALGYDTIEGYLSPNNPYFGATIGRVCNRIGGGQFTLNGKKYQLNKNIGNNHLHGGVKGFDKAIWDYKMDGSRVTMQYLSKDGEEGYPGDVTTSVTFQLTNENEFVCEMKATTLKSTPINLTNHSYFNLAGHDGLEKELFEHKVMINADEILATDGDSIPNGKKLSVVNTVYDLRVETKLGGVVLDVPENGGFDVNYCVNWNTADTVLVAKATHEKSGRILEVYSDQPGVQFYTSNCMPDEMSLDAKIIGKSGTIYTKHSAFCFETQNYPDAVNHENFPNSILNPGETYVHQVIYKFDVQS